MTSRVVGTSVRCLVAAIALVAVSRCGSGFAGFENGKPGTGTIAGGDSSNAPIIESFSPNPFAGRDSGGTVLTFTGINFADAKITVGGADCLGLAINSDGTTATCSTPAGSAGVVPVLLRTLNGTASLQFRYQGTPTLSTRLPVPFAGPIGGNSVVTVGGTDLFNAELSFGPSLCTSVAVNAGGTSATCLTPARPAGSANVTVSTPGGTSTAGFTFLYQGLPVVTTTMPTPFSGPVTGGTAVTFNGTSLQNATQITFGGVACTGLTVNPAGTLASCVTPARPAGSAAVRITTPGGGLTLGTNFLYEDSPIISSYSPHGGSVLGSTFLSIEGTNLLSTSSITVGGVACTPLNAVSPLSVNCITPPGSAGLATIVVTNASGSATISNGFTYEGAPSVTAVFPSYGGTVGGTSVAITGTALLSATSITIGGVPCQSITPISTTTSICISPGHAAGAGDVVVTNPSGSATLLNGFYFESAPTLSAIAPDGGGLAGGTVVRITGLGLGSAVSATIGGSPCTAFRSLGPTEVECTTPARPAGPANVVVLNPSGSGSLLGAFTYESAPTLTGVSPLAGPVVGNTLITLTGSQLRSASAVTVGGNPCTDVTSTSPTTVTCRTPPGLAGSVTVTVTNGTGSVPLLNGYRYEGPPSLTGVSPPAGTIAGGTVVTISGTQLASATGATFGGIACTGFSSTPTQVQCAAPAHADGPVDVVVTNVAGTDTLVGAYRYEAAPTITSVSPNAGTVAGGTLVTLTGTRFLSVYEVTVGGSTCSPVTVESTTKLTCVTGSNAAGTVPATATNYTGVGTLLNAFTFEDTPVVSTVAPTSGATPGGTTITITGSGFLTANQVNVASGECSDVDIISNTQLTCVTPPGTPGVRDVSVTNTTGTGTKNLAYTYFGAPTVTSFSPPAGRISGGTLVTFTGTNMGSAIGATFDGTPCTAFNPVNATTATCLTPAHAAGYAEIFISNLSGSGGATAQFLYEDTPVILTVTKSAGTTAGNSLVTIAGTGMRSATSASFGGVNCTSFVAVDETTVRCRTPATGASTVTVGVTNPEGTGTLPGGFTFEPAPTVSMVSPNAGPSLGGTTIVITGTNFGSATGATVGSLTCLNFTVDSPTQITCVTPARSAGPANVLVTNEAGSGALLSGFAYEGPPIISSIVPNAGPNGGGTLITINGTSLGAVTAITVAGNPCLPLVPVSGTQVRCTTPSGVLGAAEVRVTNLSGIATVQGGFTYENAPTLTSITPTAGTINGGAVITLTGTRFLSTTGITVNGVACSAFSVTNATTATCTTPAQTAGTYAVAITNSVASANLAAAFTYEGAPTISTVLLPSGQVAAGPLAGGTPIIITGTNFLTTTTVNVAAGVCAITGRTATTLNCTTPAGGAGNATVTVTNTTTNAALPAGFIYEAAPTVTLISPNTGTPNGGTTVNFTGTRFWSVSSITIGGNPCTPITIVSATSMNCPSPSGAPGARNVVVTNGTASVTVVNGFVYDTSPTVTGVSPNAGLLGGGTAVTITGSGFSSATGATFGGAACTGFTVVNASTITCNTPARPAGPVTVVVTNPAGTGPLPNAYTYEGAPTITSVNAAAGTTAGNTLVTITGTNLLSTIAGGLTFDGLPCTSVTLFSTSATCRTPAHPVAGPVDVVVTNATNFATLTNGYTYEGAATVTSVAPVAGGTGGGTIMVITGTGFLSATSANVGGTNCAATSIQNATTIRCTTPARGAGLYSVAVVNPAGTGTLPNAFRYEAAPTIATIVPNAGSTLGGNSITITGTNYLSVSAVTIGGNPCPIIGSPTSTSLTCTTPSGAIGAANVVVTNGTNSATSVNGFNFEGAPTITSISPVTGPVGGGTLVTFTGTNLRSVSAMTIGGTACTPVLVNATTVRCTTPAGLAGVVAVTATNAFSTATLPASFTYEDAPTVSAITPSALRTGGTTAITVTGTGFLTATNVTIDGFNCTGITRVNTTTITCTAPAHATEGAFDVVVTNVTGSDTLVGGAIYEGNPTISGVTPLAGSTVGGNVIAITGTRFLSTTNIDVGGVNCTSWSVVDANNATCTVPPRTVSTQTVRLTNRNNNVSFGTQYRYEGNPTITSLNIQAGSILGGDVITITGTNLQSTTGITIGGVACAAFTAPNTTTATCTTPARPAGLATIVVTSPAGNGQLVNGFLFEAAPTITSVTPAGGILAGGNTITIAGTNLASTTLVEIDGVPCGTLTRPTFPAQTPITCRPAAHAAGPEDVVVTTRHSAVTRLNGYTYEGAPTVTAITPVSGRMTGNTAVTITGTNFVSATSVNMSGTACSNVVIVNDTTITCVTGNRGSAGLTTVSVVNATATGNLLNGYLFEGNPTFTSVAPTAGGTGGGNVLTFTGTGFSSVSSITLSGTNCPILPGQTATVVTCTAPARAAGVTNVVITNTNGSVTANGAYTYEGAPTITSVLLSTGVAAAGPLAGNTQIFLTGTNFLSVVNPGGITVDGAPCTSILAVTATTLNCRTPADPTPGAVDVVLTNGFGPVTRIGGFTYEDVPTIASVNVRGGTTAGNTPIVITGTGFLSVTSVTLVTTACAITSRTATTINCLSGARGASTGDIVVTNPGGSATIVGGYSYEGSPIITAVSPVAGTLLGGTTVTFTGSGLRSVSAVNFSGTTCALQPNPTTTSFQCITGARAAAVTTPSITTGQGVVTVPNGYTYEGNPTVTSVLLANGLPAAGPLAGNTQIFLTGTNFLSTITNGITVNGNTCTAQSVPTSTTINCRTPADPTPAIVDVVLTNANGSGTRVGGFTYEGAATVTSITPVGATTAGGTTVTIVGTGFGSATAVSLVGTACTILTQNATTITCRTGARGAGTGDVIVTNPTGAGSLVGGFSYEAGPTITSVTPAQGTTAGGTLLTINGTGLRSWTSVNLSGTACAVQPGATSAQLTCLTGVRGAGTTNVVVNTGVGTATAPLGTYTYEAAPTITSVLLANGLPAAGTTAGNTQIFLTGTGFQSVIQPGGITVGGATCGTILAVTPTTLNCRTPANAVPGAYDVILTNATNSVTRVNAFTYEAAATVASILPVGGPTTGNQTVTITGTGFMSATAVTVVGGTCTILTQNATTITCRTAAVGASTGNVVVTNPAGAGTLLGGYSYENAPTITNIVPSSGPIAGGQAVTITGTGFRSTTSVNFSGTACTGIVATSTTITCTTPARGAGAANLVVNTLAGGVTANGAYTYEGLPTITSVLLSTGGFAVGPTGGNTQIFLTGTGFLTTQGITVGGLPCGSILAITPTTLNCRTPANAVPGPYDVVLTNSTGPGTRTNGFVYEGVPTVSLISPVYGSTVGNTLVTFTGANFASITSITFGGTACPIVTPVPTNGLSIQCRTPVRAAGAVNVVLTNPSGADTEIAGFTYEDAPTLTAITPNGGPIAGGTAVTLTGTRFLSVVPATGVTIGGAVCTGVVVVNATTITCNTPARPVGPRDVVVTNVYGGVTRVNFFTYDTTATLTAVTPNAGRIAGGRVVVLTGTNLSSATGATFNSVPCTVFSVTSQTTAQCTTPANSAGPVDVAITTAVNTATLVGGYTYNGTPTLTSIFPASGPLGGGTTVAMTGTGFASTTTISFGGANCTNLSIVSDTQASCRTPVRPAGPVSVVLTNDSSNVTRTNFFTYRAAPTVTSVSQTMGPIAGGTAIAITGTGFAAGATVAFGTSACNLITVVSATSITCTTAAIAAMQRVDVVVTNNDNQAGTLTSGYLYTNANTWLANTTTGAPIGRKDHVAIWSGSRMVVWGGTDATNAVTDTGGRFDPVTNSWASTASLNAPTPRTRAQAVWSGSRMIVWGGNDGTVALDTGALYDPVGDAWTAMATLNAPTPREDFTAVWNSTNNEMIVFGGQSAGVPTNTGGRYNPTTLVWNTTPMATLPVARSLHTAVWTGTTMIVWGGYDGAVQLNTGAVYTSAATNSWTATGGTPPSARSRHTAVWDTVNSRMIVWGGFDGATYVATGSTYTPGGPTWTATTGTGAPTARAYHSATWTGTRMLIWGGEDNTLTPVNTGANFNPTNSWTAITTTGAPTARAQHSAVFTNTVMTIFGGRSAVLNGLDDGAVYAP